MNIDYYSITVVALAILLCIYLIKKGYSSKVQKVLLYLVCKAEITYGSGTGKLKYSQVIYWLYDKLPNIIQILFSEKEIDAMLEDAVKLMKEWLVSKDEIACFVEKNSINK